MTGTLGGLLLAVASLCAIVSSATAQRNQQTLLSEIQARQKAIELLISWQWGRTKAQALRHIQKTEFIAEAHGQCDQPSWKFTIARNRYLSINAVTGEDCDVVGLIPD
jgi:hypothetical protein